MMKMDLDQKKSWMPKKTDFMNAGMNGKKLTLVDLVCTLELYACLNVQSI